MLHREDSYCIWFKWKKTRKRLKDCRNVSFWSLNNFVERVSHSSNLKETLCKIFKENITAIFNTISGEIIHLFQFCYEHKSRDSCICIFSKNTMKGMIWPKNVSEN